MNRILYIVFTASFFVVLTSCGSYANLYDKGNNKAVIRNLHKKALKGTLKKDQLLIFEKALQGDLLDELRLLNENLASDKAEDWKNGFLHLDNLEVKQNRYRNYPNVNTSQIDFVDISYWDEAYSDKLYTYHISNYREDYEKFLETNDKSHAIDAFYEIEKVAYFKRDDLNTDSLLSVFSELGKRRFQVNFYDHAFSDWELQQLKDRVHFASNQWSDFEADNQFDYTINISLKRLDKDNNYNQYQRQYSDEVITGYTAETNQAGDAIQVPIIEVISATVTETAFTFVVNAAIEVEIIFNETGKRVAIKSFSDNINDERVEAYLINGDLGAIPADVSVTNNSAISSSTNYDYSNMTDRLLRRLGYEVKNYVEQY